MGGYVSPAAYIRGLGLGSAGIRSAASGRDGLVHSARYTCPAATVRDGEDRPRRGGMFVDPPDEACTDLRDRQEACPAKDSASPPAGVIVCAYRPSLSPAKRKQCTPSPLEGPCAASLRGVYPTLESASSTAQVFEHSLGANSFATRPSRLRLLGPGESKRRNAHT
ncbi:hypothetical protein WOLCODRAFT_149892 [Wolfiporia cocos MD-104 SS10]|uniref:Uncharacterized protein n=1 Tax=Wolfiporia cocos (strain MD-104) TaxID=742152 RepID=A0A2H3JC61_WOLCO|nr:hypothetical protein WOLCODRAFT_149892 [Wolfiporia cocos MD-104 SS10]